MTDAVGPLNGGIRLSVMKVTGGVEGRATPGSHLLQRPIREAHDGEATALHLPACGGEAAWAS